jgi:hypothetical protein
MQTENGKSICKLKMEKVIRKNKLELKIKNSPLCKNRFLAYEFNFL